MRPYFGTILINSIHDECEALTMLIFFIQNESTTFKGWRTT